MLIIISLIMVLGYSLYFYVSSRTAESSINPSFAKCTPMVLGMTSSLTIGLLIAIWIPQKLAVATIFSIILSAGIAYLLGARFGLSGVIEAQVSSLMGAMMGAMLGVMLSANEITLMVLAMDSIFLFSIFSMMMFLTNSPQKAFFKRKHASFYLIFLLGIGIISTIGMFQMDITNKNEIIIENHHEH